ncbi:hypothetical protein PV325_013586 [Microctonus aethiopoides]|uniref:B-related factor 1 n=1 Tax=Microctonus aethiopoides TaxID=144406 RepID=A0AA39FAJ5_9HYME|nr:hypothetical protein PV325_013586 [Microctonus aethiopoides]KAK0091679.1 hypothetical protein PV326_002865 [Microctonus aethiopoides]KAK0165856.1 hypothetical protein PV328_004339 [Microctonus aethiopoides]
MPSNKCKSCGSTEIETDPARGDAVCIRCGTVLEDQLIVSETTFEESSSGRMSVVGDFVSKDSSGGATGFGASYHVNGKESREITLQNARRGIAHLCGQLGMNAHCIDISVNFYKMALARQLTRGRKQVHNHAACVYLTCRTEGLGPMLIDISDVLQIDVNELGRTYLRFTQALNLQIPSIDPCLYIIRFAKKLDLGDRETAVSNTALRLVQRMKRDSIHSGRRPSGLCGAALLIAARLHEFNRTPSDVIKIVQVHESTLRKRLIEFGDTPSSHLTLDEFMTVDLEEEQDPPAFKAARKKDREQLKYLEKYDGEFDDLQNEINRKLDEHIASRRKRSRYCGESNSNEDVDTDRFIQESTLDVIQNCVDDPDNPDDPVEKQSMGLGPNIASMNLPSSIHENRSTGNDTVNAFENETGELDITDFDDDELDAYILTDTEANRKKNLWNTVNADYLKDQEEKEQQRLREQAEGKPEKKKRRTSGKKKNQGPANSAGEAIEKMLQEKRISSKINYEVLKSLNVGSSSMNNNQKMSVDVPVMKEEVEVASISTKFDVKPRINVNALLKSSRKTNKVDDIKVSPKKKNVTFEEPPPVEQHIDEAEIADDMEDEEEIDELNEGGDISVAQMLLRDHTEEEEDYGYNCEDEY